MTVAILYICTGKYSQFFEGFHKSCDKYFLPEFSKTYFVWTDKEDILVGKTDVFFFKKKCEGFPADSLFRFEMFLQAEEELKKYDYIFFFNANTEIKQEVGLEILPDHTGLSMGVWPGRVQMRSAMFYPYERNKLSLAYVAPYGKNYIYYMGGINGGTSEAYLKMMHVLCENIKDDYERGIIAKVHDESHINAYLRIHSCKRLGAEFCWPEEWKAVGFSPKIVFRNKVYIDSSFNKGRNRSLSRKIKKCLRMVKDAIAWYI